MIIHNAQHGLAVPQLRDCKPWTLGVTFMKVPVLYILFLVAGIVSCRSNSKSDSTGKLAQLTHKLKAGVIDTLCELGIGDSVKLRRVKGQFYRGVSGHLYERTFHQREMTEDDSTMFVEYFNGCILQDIDPLTFKELDGWYAKDKRSIYYYRPTSLGMSCARLDDVDINTFKMLSEEYAYASDKRYVFKGGERLPGLNSWNLKISRDSSGNITKLTSGKQSYTPD